MESKNGEVKKKVDTLVKLDYPFPMPDGRTIDKIDVNISPLNLGDLHNMEMEFAALFPGVTPTNGIFMTDSKYQAIMIARVNNMVYDNIRALSSVDAFEVSNRLARFLSKSA